MRRSQVLALAGRLAEDLPAITVGGAGCLLELWLDRDAIDLLRLIDGWDDAPAAGGGLAWHRDRGDPAYLVLERPVLGLQVAALDPSRLADALECVATRADALLPRVQAALTRDTPPDAEELDEDPAERLRHGLATVLQRALPFADAPPGTRLRPGETPPVRHRRRLDPDGVRPALHTPEVQDHRAVIPPRPAPIPES